MCLGMLECYSEWWAAPWWRTEPAWRNSICSTPISHSHQSKCSWSGLLDICFIKITCPCYGWGGRDCEGVRCIIEDVWEKPPCTILCPLFVPFFYIVRYVVGISYGLDIDVILERLILSVRTHHSLLKADKGLFCWLEIQGQQQRERAV